MGIRKTLEDRTGSYRPSLGDVGIVTPPSFFNSKPLCSFNDYTGVLLYLSAMQSQ
nr:MAG TPA: hypothetical protein [Caudoviricetes sp.]